ncbi:hypothetical protein DLAC_10522 [Tieghemostelium lacteum]|uniref:PQ-loop repeat-containing protein n=1 Tax=Tieghemostelium lacteum TaxID=361077 RepID=A0A151Z4P3_TIELA|nr:hypothetical protein DLAC_10522 [Tieghemostelium lacteum]|eukprot:KYQ88939.1 hypothetical protein DLAC_10522 [Tieghemostelium lacteum]
MSKSCINGTIAPITQTDFESILIPMDTFDVTLGIILILGAIISTVPQHMKILKNKSAAGLSFLWLFLGNINQYATFINGVVLKYPQIQACSKLGFLQCSPSLLSLFQLFVFWLFSFPFYVYFLFFTPSDLKKLAKENLIEARKSQKEFLYAKILFIIEVSFIIICTVIMFSIIRGTGECSKTTFVFGNVIGIFSVVITFVQWSPQIYKTAKYKSPGSFSIIMLLIQGPGTLVLLYYFIFVSKEQVSTWLSYLAAVIQLFIVLGLLIYYQRKDKAKEAEEDDKTDSSDVSFSPNTSIANYSEVQPLLLRSHKINNNDGDDNQQEQQQQQPPKDIEDINDTNNAILTNNNNNNLDNINEF